MADKKFDLPHDNKPQNTRAKANGAEQQQRSTLELWQLHLRSLHLREPRTAVAQELIDGEARDNTIYPFLP